MSMTTDQNDQARPVRVPNVSANARSGLDHEPIGANAVEAYNVNQALAAGEVPEDLRTVQDLLVWADGDPARARLVMDQEQSASSPRVTLIEALGAILSAPLPDSGAPEDGDPTNGALPTGTDNDRNAPTSI